MARPPLTLGPKPPRKYPNMNAQLALRLFAQAGGPSVILPAGKQVGIGTIPGNSHLNLAEVGVSAGVLPAGLTLDVGTLANPTAFVTAQALDASGTFVSANPLGYIADDTVVYARLNGAGPVSAGRINALLTFYANTD